MSHRFENACALLIAVDQNREASAALPAVAADARALRDVLVHPARCGYAPDKLRLLTRRREHPQGVFDALDWLADELAAIPDGDSTAILYFSGHGHVEGDEHYLIPYDLNLRRMRSSAIRADRLCRRGRATDAAPPARRSRLLSRGRHGGQAGRRRRHSPARRFRRRSS
jgi:hypothetical protein